MPGIVIKRNYVTFIIMEILKRSSIVDADDLIGIDCNAPIPQLNDIADSVARKSVTAIDGSKRIVILCMKRGVSNKTINSKSLITLIVDNFIVMFSILDYQ